MRPKKLKFTFKETRLMKTIYKESQNENVGKFYRMQIQILSNILIKLPC